MALHFIFSFHFPRVPLDPSAIGHCARELPVDCGGPDGGGAHQTGWRRSPPGAGFPIFLPLPAASHHPGCWLLPAHSSVHGEPGHDLDICCYWYPVECLLHRGPAVRCVSDPASQSIQPPPAGAAALPAVRLHRIGRGSCCCPGCLWGDPHKWTFAHPGVWWITAQRCCHCGETFMRKFLVTECIYCFTGAPIRETSWDKISLLSVKYTYDMWALGCSSCILITAVTEYLWLYLWCPKK